MGSAVGSVTALTALGTITIAHGLITAPTVVLTTPYAADTLSCYKTIALMGFDNTYATFIVASCAPKTSAADTTLLATGVTSQVTVSFVWMALR
jgi:hypothetical protein